MDDIRVIVADDHPVVRVGICDVLRREPDIKVVGEAINGLQAVKLVEELQPDVFILDVQMPGMNGVQVARHIRDFCPGVRVLVLSAFTSDDFVFGMLAEGVVGYLLKDDAVEDVVSAVRAVARAEMWLSPQVASRVVGRAVRQPSSQPEAEQLTERELQVLRLMARGCSNEDIAESLCVTRRTVRFHVSNLFSKLEATSRVEVVVEGIRQGLIRV